MDIFDVLHGHLVFLLLFWYILLRSGTLVASWVHFPKFCFFAPRKIWQPCSRILFEFGTHKNLFRLTQIVRQLSTTFLTSIQNKNEPNNDSIHTLKN
jgi:hypothetical protein